MTKILIVEDDRNVVSFLTTILLGAGHICVTASSARKAHELLKSERDIGLVLLDQNLGDDSDTGLTLLKSLRQSPKFQSVPVIICSGDSRTAVVSGFIGQRIAGFLKKPFRSERLLADIQRVLGQEGNAITCPPPLAT